MASSRIGLAPAAGRVRRRAAARPQPCHSVGRGGIPRGTAPRRSTAVRPTAHTRLTLANDRGEDSACSPRAITPSNASGFLKRGPPADVQMRSRGGRADTVLPAAGPHQRADHPRCSGSSCMLVDSLLRLRSSLGDTGPSSTPGALPSLAQVPLCYRPGGPLMPRKPLGSTYLPNRMPEPGALDHAARFVRSPRRAPAGVAPSRLAAGGQASSWLPPPA